MFFGTKKRVGLGGMDEHVQPIPENVFPSDFGIRFYFEKFEPRPPVTRVQR